MTENSHRHRSHRRANRLQFFLRRYTFEIVWLAVIALGIFLIFERMNIRHNLFVWASRIAKAALRGAGQFGDTISGWLARTTPSDAIGILLVIGALLAIVLRLRWRLLHNPALSAQVCPKCQGPIHRVHRSWTDHLINTFVPVRRFHCANRECRWKGLRIHTSGAGGRIQTTSATTKTT